MLVLGASSLWSALWDNLGIAVALMLLIGFAQVHLSERWPALAPWVTGGLFAAAGIAVMQSPFPVRHGVLIDVRDVVVVLAGATGGPIPGALATIAVAAYRLTLGGAGTLGGTCAIVTSGLLGLAWYRWRARGRSRIPVPELAVLGLILATVFLPWGLVLPASVRWVSIRRSAGPVYVLFPVGTVLLGTLIALERTRAEALRRLRVTQERLRLGIALAPAGVVTLDDRGCFIEVNEAFCRMLGRTAEDLVGLSVADVTHPDDVAATRDAARRLTSGELSTYTADKRYLRPDGSVVWASVASTVLPALEGGQTGVFTLVEDLTKWKLAEERLRELARADELTGLPNRTELTRRLNEALSHSQRTGQYVAVLFLDLDRFKDTNDHLGHHIGDLLLQGMAERLRCEVRPSDVVGRLGGDEFVLVLGELDDPEEAVEIAARVQAAVGRPMPIAGMKLTGTASIGIAHTVGHTVDASTLIQHADIAMYRAKSSGPGQIEVFDDNLRRQVRRRYSIEHALKQAVERDELRVHYQPIVSLHTGAITAVEALLRWEHPSGTMISPAEFIPIAEETGSIRSLGAWVSREACRQASEWEQLGIEPIPIHINVSAVQLRSRSFLEMLRSAISDAGVAPTRLCVELTESVLLDEVDRTVERLVELARLGVGIAIDDFGTGYSSLAYLQRFPADELKVDRSLIATMADDAADIIAEMTVGLGEALNLELIAEGIEESWQADRLRGLGYHRAQGYYFAPAQPAAELGPQLPRRAGERPPPGEIPVVSYQTYCALEQHPAVQDAAAIQVGGGVGDATPEVMAFVVIAPGAPPIAPDVLAAWCEERLPAFAVPRYYTLVDRLPKGPSPRSSPRRLRQMSRELPTWDRLARRVRHGVTPAP